MVRISRSRSRTSTSTSRSGREVLVRVVASGVCHSDLHFVDGFYPFPTPAILGHEAAGIVEEVGLQVTEFKPGDHVIACLSVFCGHCDYCLTGKTHLCQTRPDARQERAAQAVVEGPARQPVRQPLGLRGEDAGARKRAREDRRRHAARPRRADRLRRHHGRGCGAEHGSDRAGLHRGRLRRGGRGAGGDPGRAHRRGADDHRGGRGGFEARQARRSWAPRTRSMRQGGRSRQGHPRADQRRRRTTRSRRSASSSRPSSASTASARAAPRPSSA